MLKGTFDALEIARWPLMHGTTQYGEGLERIRRNGLAAGAAVNSFDYDRELGRTGYVFLAPASFRFNYGFGAGILVDPEVVLTPGVHCSDQDIGNAVECVKIWLDDGDCGGLTRDRVKKIDVLQQIVDAHRAQPDNPIDSSEGLTALQIVASASFRAYYAEHYSMSPESLFRVIADTAAREGYSLRRYFGRTVLWDLTEEILVPRKVEPYYLLGHWDGTEWREWAQAKSPDTRDRLRRWLDAFARH